ncbi:hypothetical protein HanIR_Chr16g0789941 [Helianthus annuus]|nr:hypothetical protein HanIR_Chr16g0789941 [Helianthus annuus]
MMFHWLGWGTRKAKRILTITMEKIQSKQNETKDIAGHQTRCRDLDSDAVPAGGSYSGIGGGGNSMPTCLTTRCFDSIIQLNNAP